ncbi:MAG: C4-dicarboxylate ABC transporter substrate-binding protein, partial [Rhodospirillaceae bacterium]|nr:C4-dicarboxylate ABC transporter substrate-binding protein [Rhodospirillaceae bacterium]
MLKTLYRSFAVAGIAIMAATGIAEAQEKTFYKMGTFPPGTSVNIIHTAWANAVNRHVPNAEVQLSASGPATRHMLQVAAG